METQELFLIVYLSVGFGFATCAHTNYLLGIRDGDVPEEDRLSGGGITGKLSVSVFLMVAGFARRSDLWLNLR